MTKRFSISGRKWTADQIHREPKSKCKNGSISFGTFSVFSTKSLHLKSTCMYHIPSRINIKLMSVTICQWRKFRRSAHDDFKFLVVDLTPHHITPFPKMKPFCSSYSNLRCKLYILNGSPHWMKWFMLLEIQIKLVQWHCLQLFPTVTDQIYVQLPPLNNLMKTCSLIP